MCGVVCVVVVVAMLCASMSMYARLCMCVFVAVQLVERQVEQRTSVNNGDALHLLLDASVYSPATLRHLAGNARDVVRHVRFKGEREDGVHSSRDSAARKSERGAKGKRQMPTVGFACRTRVFRKFLF